MVACPCNQYFWLTVFIIVSIGMMMIFSAYKYEAGDFYFIRVIISKSIFDTDEKFLSVALDTSFLRHSFPHFDKRKWEDLEKLSNYLKPSYLRLGGTEADLVIFEENEYAKNSGVPTKSYVPNPNFCKDQFNKTDYLYISSEVWRKIQEFIQNSNLDFLFDVNVLLRNNGNWDSTNAEVLLHHSENDNFMMDFQLGNEPNSFRHVFNVSISGEQLAEDFDNFRNLLNSTKKFRSSKLIGPDVTRPRLLDSSSLKYLKDFLSNTKSLSAVSWHQYYFNGRTASLKDFIDINLFDVLAKQIKAIKQVVNDTQPYLPIWLSETSSAYGGGAPGLSNRYVASFIWLDKLGLAAKMGISVVIRQTLFQGFYSLIDSDLKPLPDYWISLFYKKLVGERVFEIENFGVNKDENLRFYAHCTKRYGITQLSNSEKGITLFGMNLNNSTKDIVVSGMKITYPIYSYIFTPEHGNLTSKSILLNGRKLSFLKHFDFENRTVEVTLPLRMPPFSIAFWIFRGDYWTCP